MASVAESISSHLISYLSYFPSGGKKVERQVKKESSRLVFCCGERISKLGVLWVFETVETAASAASQQLL